LDCLEIILVGRSRSSYKFESPTRDHESNVHDSVLQTILAEMVAFWTIKSVYDVTWHDSRTVLWPYVPAAVRKLKKSTAWSAASCEYCLNGISVTAPTAAIEDTSARSCQSLLNWTLVFTHDTCPDEELASLMSWFFLQ
jgi:hypothetical protein